ncbi:hypothetical protein CPC08DRAFT_697996 [Agrocybe pediades]|nr:hypothetical protein CPC08DRAFT_697996 [Agrocybe pediades]
MANTSLELPNPLTPMAFFPPNLAYQVTVAQYVLVGCTAVLIWDILINLQTDIKMFKRFKVTLSVVVYIISRFSALFYLLAVTVLQTAPLFNCHKLYLVLQVMYPFVIPSTSLLFFFRVRGLYAENGKVVAFFFFMWLAVIAASITPSTGVSVMNIGTSHYCTNSGLAPYVAAAGIIPFVNDTLVFFATSWRLWQNAYVTQSIQNNVKVMVFGHHLPSFSRALLKDGQAYYLTIISMNLVTIALFFNNSISPVYRSFIATPNVVLMNSMACHVYRKIRFGIYQESATMNASMSLPRHQRTVLSTIVFGTTRNQGADLGTMGTRHDGNTTTLEVGSEQTSNTFTEKEVHKDGQSSQSDIPPV